MLRRNERTCDQAVCPMTFLRLSTSYFSLCSLATATTLLLKSKKALSISLVKFSSANLSCEFHVLGHLTFVSASKKPPNILCLAKLHRCSAFVSISDVLEAADTDSGRQKHRYINHNSLMLIVRFQRLKWLGVFHFSFPYSFVMLPPVLLCYWKPLDMVSGFATFFPFSVLCK